MLVPEEEYARGYIYNLPLVVHPDIQIKMIVGMG